MAFFERPDFPPKKERPEISPEEERLITKNNEAFIKFVIVPCWGVACAIVVLGYLIYLPVAWISGGFD